MNLLVTTFWSNDIPNPGMDNFFQKIPTHTLYRLHRFETFDMRVVTLRCDISLKHLDPH